MSETTHETFATSTIRHSTFDPVAQGSNDVHTSVQEVRSSLQHSVIQSIVLIFTCTVAVVVNVCVLPLASIPQCPINFFL